MSFRLFDDWSKDHAVKNYEHIIKNSLRKKKEKIAQATLTLLFGCLGVLDFAAF